MGAVGDPALRTTFLYARGRERAVTAAETAAALGVHRTVARWRLERLADAGLLVRAFERRTGRTGPGAGRPSKTYAVAPETTQTEFPPRRYDELVSLLIGALPRRRRSERLADVGAAFGWQLARATRVRPARRARVAAERVCAAFRSLGFHASVESAHDAEVVFSTLTCPLRPVVVGEPGAREVDRGMWRALVAEALTGVDVSDVRCETEDCLAAASPCRVVVALRRSNAAE